jgi:hypothetical protein
MGLPATVAVATSQAATPAAHVTAHASSSGTVAIQGSGGGGPESLPSQVPAPYQAGIRPVHDDIGAVPKNAPHVPVSVKLGKPTSTTIQPGMAGLSYETYTLIQDPNYFTPQNTQLINLFKSMGIKHIRVGGDTVDYQKQSPTIPEINNLFEFAKQVPGLKIIYSLRMINGKADQDAQTAAYIWQHYSNQVESFAVGNEPNLMQWFHDSQIHNYDSYQSQWLDFAKAIQKAAPGAPISGPDTAGNNNYPGHSTTFDMDFVHAAQKAGIQLASVNTHDYVAGFPKKTAADAVSDMLSPQANAHEASYDAHVARPLERMGLTVQMTEDNDELIGNHGASDAMASALFTENNLFQLADGGVTNAYFHNLRFDTRTIYETNSGQFAVNPKGEAIAAFNRFAQGNVTPVSVSNPDDVNLHAYAVTGRDHQVELALINQSYGPQGKTADVSIQAPAGATVTFLQAPHDNVQADTGVKLGGAQISSSTPDLHVGSVHVPAHGDGEVTIQVPAASIAFVKV